MEKRLAESYRILDQLRQPNGMYVAAPSNTYHYTWLRDTFYEALPYLDKQCDRYEKTYHAILDIFRKYEYKIDIHTKQKPHYKWEYIHPRYTLDTLEEVKQEWGNAQNDAIGAVLFGIGQGVKAGKKIIRDQKDHEIVQKLVNYLACCQYWMDSDNSAWEEWEELHSNSIAACVAGLQAVRDIVFVERELVLKGYRALANMFPYESADRPVDLIQLTMIYPYKVLFGHDAKIIIDRVEKHLLRSRGVIRYKGDSYFSTIEHEGRHHPLQHYYGTEAEWTMGLPFLALACIEIGDIDKAKYYIHRTEEEVMMENGGLPELYYANSERYNENSPLGWSQALYIIAKEKLNKLI